MEFSVVRFEKRRAMENDDLREFMLILRRALLMIVKWIERKYQLSVEKN